MFTVVTVKCPKCGAEECHPTQPVVLIRGCKHRDEQGNWWSQCLVCAGGYSKDLSVFTEANHNPSKGWFC